MSAASIEDDDLLFLDEEPQAGRSEEGASPWKVLIVDDEPEVVNVSRQTLAQTRVEERPLRLLEAGSAGAARQSLEEHPDVAVVLLDVMMETPTAGIDLARWIQGDGPRPPPQVILRTGQPGRLNHVTAQAGLLLHSYLEKTELTAERLRSAVADAVRAYVRLHPEPDEQG